MFPFCVPFFVSFFAVCPCVLSKVEDCVVPAWTASVEDCVMISACQPTTDKKSTDIPPEKAHPTAERGRSKRLVPPVARTGHRSQCSDI